MAGGGPYAVRPCIRSPRWSPAAIVLGSLLIALIVALAIIIDLEHAGSDPANSTMVEEAVVGSGSLPAETTAVSEDQTTLTTTPRPVVKPPTEATHQVTCHAPPGAGGRSTVNGLCWINKRHLVATQLAGQQVIRFTVDVAAGTCVSTVIDSGYSARSVACAPDGTVYVTNTGGSMKRVSGGESSDWAEELGNTTHTVASNDEHVLVGLVGTHPVYLYSHSGQQQSTMDVSSNRYPLDFTHLTPDGSVVATSEKGYLLIASATDTFSNSDFGMPQGVSSAPGNSIIVCDRIENVFKVFTATGDYMHDLTWHGEEVTYPSALAILTLDHGEDPDVDGWMAACSGEDGLIKVYSLNDD